MTKNYPFKIFLCAEGKIESIYIFTRFYRWKLKKDVAEEG